MAKKRAGVGFEAQLYKGHDETCAVHVPFDPREVWGDPRSDIVVGRSKKPRRAHRVRGTVNGVSFESAIWFYFRNFVMIIDADTRKRAKARPGDMLEFVIDVVVG